MENISRLLVILLGTIFCSLHIDSAIFETHPAFNGQLYTTVFSPRGLVLEKESGDIFVLSRVTGFPRIVSIYETVHPNNTVTVSQFVIVSGNGLGINHGLAIHNGFIYASSSSTVYRWPYVSGQRETITEPEEIVITGVPPNGGHVTRTLEFDSNGLLYVSVGSAGNVDADSRRARINRFDLTWELPIPFNDGEIFADGLRNEVGLAFDSNGVLWGVENGVDQLNRPDLGGDIHNGNPAEEMNKFDRPAGTHYGYPYCFSSYKLENYTAGTQFAHPTFMNDGIHTDEWCRDPANNQPPTFSMPAHHAPLGIHFYDIESPGCDGIEGGFPCFMRGDAFVAFHGSWNSDDNVGYRVAWIPLNKSTFEPTGTDISIVFEPRVPAGCGITCFRPVNVIFDNKGRMIISTDYTNEIFRVFFNHVPLTII